MVASDWYAILGIKATATDDEIKKAYRKKALQYHPDKNSSSTAEEIFKEINKAYETLSDVDKRRAYDLQYQTTNTRFTSSSSSRPQQQRRYEPPFHTTGRSHFNSTHNNFSRFRFHDPFFTLNQRHAYFTGKMHSPSYSFFETNFGSSDDNDDDEIDSDHFDPILSTFHSSQRRFRRKTRSKRSHPTSYESDPFAMFEMLTRSIFDQFIKDDFFWQHSSARLHNSSPPQQQQQQAQQRTTTTTTAAARTEIPVNHVTPPSQPRYEMKRTSMSSAHLHSKDSDDDDDAQEYFLYEQSKPTTTTTNDYHFRPRTNDTKPTAKPKLESCQYCFRSITPTESRSKHEALCRQRPDQEKVYTTKCSYCHENIRLNEYLDHEEVCKQNGINRQPTETKRYHNPLSKCLYGDNQTSSKSSSGGSSNDNDRLRTCQRCQKTFPVLSDLFNHICDDENDSVLSQSGAPLIKSDNRSSTDHTSSLLDKISSTSTKSFKLNRLPTFNNSPISSSHVHKLISPLSTSTSKQTNPASIHISIVEELKRPTRSTVNKEHIPAYKRPLFQPDRTASNHKQSQQPTQHSSAAYVYLRNPSSSSSSSSPIHVNS